MGPPRPTYEGAGSHAGPLITRGPLVPRCGVVCVGQRAAGPYAVPGPGTSLPARTASLDAHWPLPHVSQRQPCATPVARCVTVRRRPRSHLWRRLAAGAPSRASATAWTSWAYSLFERRDSISSEATTTSVFQCRLRHCQLRPTFLLRPVRMKKVHKCRGMVRVGQRSGQGAARGAAELDHDALLELTVKLRQLSG